MKESVTTLAMNRMLLGWENILSTRSWRPRDFFNWADMLREMRALSSEDVSLNVNTLAYQLFTRTSFAYTPVTDIAKPERAGMLPAIPGEPRVGLFVDAPDHLSGVATTLGSWSRQAHALKLPFRLHHAGREGLLPNAKEFAPIGHFKVSAYAGLELGMPKVKEVHRYMMGQGFDVIHTSTPGFMGLIGLGMARRLGIPVCGTYHTDFPRYALQLTGDPHLAGLTRQYMLWFYGQLDAVAAPSNSTKDDLISMGLREEKIFVVGRGVELSHFRPGLRDETLRNSWDPKRPNKLLYVGRVSSEKNLNLLATAFQRLLEKRDDSCLVVVGDGPYREEMEQRLAGLPVVFTGVQRGEDLARIYASSDLFVFPSLTDTFGVVLIEAQASGVPVIVSSQGGPKDCVRDGETGRVIPNNDAASWAAAIDELLSDPERLAGMKQAALLHSARFTPRASFDAFWNFNRKVAQNTGTGALHTPNRSMQHEAAHVS